MNYAQGNKKTVVFFVALTTAPSWVCCRADKNYPILKTTADPGQGISMFKAVMPVEISYDY